MDIQPAQPVNNNMTRIIDSTRHDDHDQPPKRHPQRKREKIVPTSVYTPDGHVEEEAVSKIDISA